jgi:hypothetical protein
LNPVSPRRRARDALSTNVPAYPVRPTRIGSRLRRPTHGGLLDALAAAANRASRRTLPPFPARTGLFHARARIAGLPGTRNRAQLCHAPASLRELADSPEVDADEVLTWARELAEYAAPGGGATSYRAAARPRCSLTSSVPVTRCLSEGQSGSDARGCSPVTIGLSGRGDRIRRVAGVEVVITPSKVEL